MTSGIAAPFTNANAAFSRFETGVCPGKASNDNGMLDTSDDLLHAALRHFAKHGLGAAREAREQAEQAFFDGDRLAYDWWLAISRTLDRQTARQVEYGFDQKLVPAG